MTTNLDRALNRSVVQESPTEASPTAGLVLSLASVADSFMAWGRDLPFRDQQLRDFWPTEPVLASAIYTVVGRNAALSWELEGPGRTVRAVQQMLHNADGGRGWQSFLTKVCIDYLTQDNGGFIELVRDVDSPDGAVIGVNHLDAARCRRTGRRDFPVIYTDRQGTLHRLAWYQVKDVVEFPSPVETMNGAQLCAVSRILRAAQILRDISVYKREKIGGINPQSVYIVSGVKAQEISDGLTQHKDEQLQQGFIRYVKPLIYSTLDPTSKPDVAEIALKGLPDGFNEDETMRWYINQLAMGFGIDYQDLAPLPGRALGSGQQSLVLHMKSRGKGPAIFMKEMEHFFNFRGAIPQNVSFKWAERDLAEDQENADLEDTHARTHKTLNEIGAFGPEAVLQRMLDRQEITAEEFEAELARLQDRSQQQERRLELEAARLQSMTPIAPAGGESGGDVTDEVTGHDDERVEVKGVKADDQVEELTLEARMEAEAALERDMAAALERAFNLIRQAILGEKGLFRRKQGPEDILADEELWERVREELVGAVQPHTRQVMRSALDANERMGLIFNWDQANQDVLSLSARYTNDWWDRLDTTTRDGLRSAITSWQETGLGRQGLPDLVDSIEPLFGRDRARRIATTETTRIFDRGNNLAHIAAGVEMEEWMTVRDARVCPICDPLDRERFPVQGGPRPVDDTHIGCRCNRLPVVGELTLGAT